MPVTMGALDTTTYAGEREVFAVSDATASTDVWVVTTPEVSAVRDADRIIGLLEANELKSPTLIINRVRNDMVKRGEMMSIEDVMEILSVNLIGVVPDDEGIVVTTNQGDPIVASQKYLAGQAYRNIVHRILGEDVPILDLEKCNSFKLVNLWLHCNNIYGYTSDIIDVVEAAYNIKINENGNT